MPTRPSAGTLHSGWGCGSLIARKGISRWESKEADSNDIEQRKSLSHRRIRSELMMGMIVRGQSMAHSDTALSRCQGMNTRSQRRSRLPARKEPNVIFHFATAILHVLRSRSVPFLRSIFFASSASHRFTLLIAISNHPSLALIARHCFSTCDHHNPNTSSRCRLKHSTRSSTFAAFPTCAHPTLPVVPRHR